MLEIRGAYFPVEFATVAYDNVRNRVDIADTRAKIHDAGAQHVSGQASGAMLEAVESDSAPTINSDVFPDLSLDAELV